MMLDLLLAILAVTLVIVALFVGVSLLTGAGLAILSGTLLERLFDLLVPRRGTGVGPEDLVGLSGIVVQAFGSNRASTQRRGMVRLGGERWSAEAVPGTALTVGDPVRVVAVDGLVVVVEPADETAEGATKSSGVEPDGDGEVRRPSAGFRPG